MIKADKERIQMEGISIELIGELRGISVAARKMFARNFGKETADKLVDAIFSSGSDTDSAQNIVDIIKNHHEDEEEKPVTSGNRAVDLLIEALFGRGDK